MVPGNIRLYNFVDNHDVERISSKLMNKAHYLPVHILLYTLYYGSEFGIEGRKERYSDDSLRPAIDLKEHADDREKNACTRLIAALGKIHLDYKQDLVCGDYRQLCLTNQQFAYARGRLIAAVNNSDGEAWINVEAGSAASYVGLLSGKRLENSSGRLNFSLPGASGDIFVPEDGADGSIVTDAPFAKEIKAAAEAVPSETKEAPAVTPEEAKTAVRKTPRDAQAAAPKPSAETKAAPVPKPPEADVKIPDIPYDLMTVEQLHAVILSKMAKNGPVTDQMRREVTENIWHNSLVNWANSFR